MERINLTGKEADAYLANVYKKEARVNKILKTVENIFDVLTSPVVAIGFCFIALYSTYQVIADVFNNFGKDA